jgi:choline dehydrogenase-like flavoprotein
MGAGPADSVTDAWGRVHGVPWLYVADGSLFPRCAEINPYVTIMALADRVAERVRLEWPHLKDRFQNLRTAAGFGRENGL